MKQLLGILSIMYIHIGIAQDCLFFPLSYDHCEVQAIAHRGYSAYYPENSLMALEEAFKRGIKLAEIDVQMTYDSVVVLFHDQPYITRTSNGNGMIRWQTFDALNQYDFGSWKGSLFQSTPITTLREAMILADKYGAQLYLDTKHYTPSLYKQLINELQLSPTVLLPAVNNVQEAALWSANCTECESVYFGGLPSQLDSLLQYLNLLKANQVKAVELYFELALFDSDAYLPIRLFTSTLNMELWVFTTNDVVQFEQLANLGVDAIETDIPSEMMQWLCSDNAITPTLPKYTTGNWNFSNNNLEANGSGSTLLFKTLNNDTVLPSYAINNTKNFNIANLPNGLAQVMRLPPLSQNQALMAYTNFIPLADADLSFEYSFICDLLIPNESHGNWISILQTNANNINDADIFINPDGQIGIGGDYFGNIIADTWHRIIITFNREEIAFFIDGVHVGAKPIDGNRWSAINTFPGGDDQGILLFTDDDNETALIYISAIQLRNYQITNATALSLGQPKAEGIPSSNTSFRIESLGNIPKESIAVDWSTNQVLISTKSFDNRFAHINFVQSKGSSCSILSGQVINLENPFVIISEDQSQSNIWNFCYTASNVGNDDYSPNGLSLHPNPASNSIYINTLSASCDYRLFNMMGEQIQSGTVDTHSPTINISSLSAQTYVIELSNSSQKQWMTFIKFER